MSYSPNKAATSRKSLLLAGTALTGTPTRIVLALALAGSATAIVAVPSLTTPAAAQAIQSGGGAGGGPDGGAGGLAGGGGGEGGGTGGNGGDAAQDVGGQASAGGDSPTEPSTGNGNGGPGGDAPTPNNVASGGGGGGGGGGNNVDGNQGGPGGYGGAGASGNVDSALDITLASDSLGGDGATGQDGSGSPAGGRPGYGGGGGGGGAGLVLTGPNAQLTTNGNDITGGRGGRGVGVGSGGGGGAGLALLDGGAITVTAGSVIAGGRGGAADPYSGEGGAGVFLYNGGDLTNLGAIRGGAGNGIDVGADGNAAVLMNGGSIDNHGTIDGGRGGDGISSGGNGGGGVRAYGGDITNEDGSTITGGDGGDTMSPSPAYSGGGAGVIFVDEADGGSLENFGQIAGGAGGAATAAGTPGAGGVGVIVNDDAVTIVNGGTIAGGLSGHADPADQVQANALELNGAGNTLELRGGYSFTGNVIARGAGNILALGGNTDPADPFDVTDLDAGGQYQGFETFEKTGASTWTLTGSTTAVTPWRLTGGTLSVSSDEELGDVSGALAFDGGTLRNTAAFSTGRNATVDTNGATFQTDADLELTGTVSPSASDGTFTKTGSATLTLSGDGSGLSGNTTVSEGTLAITGQLRSFDGSIYYTGSDPDGIAAAKVTGTGSSWTLNDNLYVGGTGTLDITDGGRVKTSNAGFIGVSAGSTGTVTVTGPNSVWTLDNSLLVGPTGAGTLTVADGGTVSTPVITIAVRPGSAGTVNIGAAAGDPAAAAGTLDVGSLTFGDGDGTLVFNHTGDAYGFDTLLASANAGDGLIHNYAGTTVLTGVSSAFDGATTVSGGRLVVDRVLGGTATVGNGGTLIVGDDSHATASLAGTATVESGGTLGGSGTVGATTVADGGHIAPGNSIGALKVDGDLLLSSGSILDFELGSSGTTPDAGASDRIDVSGDLTLDGTLNLAQSGDAADGTAALGYYRLMTYRGNLTDNMLAFGDTPALTDPAAYQIQADGGNVDLFVAAAGDDTLQHWQGGDGTWNGTDATWQNVGKDATPGEIPVAWAGNHAVFENEPGGFDGGTIAVEGTLDFKGLQFRDEGFRLEGTGALETQAGGSEIRVLADSAQIATEITGAGGITKTQGGTLVLEGANTYTGGTRLLGGAVESSQDASLGAASGGLAFNGGTLRVTGTGFTQTGRAIDWGANGGGFDIAEPANTFTLGQDLTGGGDLHKLGAGTLVLEGTNNYGDTAVIGGELIGDAGSISGNIANAGTVTFDQADDASFAGDIAGLGGTDGQMVKQGAGTLTLAGTSALDWTVDAGGLVSAADRFAGNVEIGGGGAFTFDQDNDAQYAGALSGTGRFTKTGDGALAYDGDGSAFAGTIDIGGGALIVGSDAAHANAVLGGSFDVQDGGTLGGHGTVGGVTLAPGAIIAPGNSIGTVTVNGDIAFNAGSTYEVEVDPDGADSDLIHATGKAFLNDASVAHIGLDGSYDPFSTYTILVADDGIDGRFGDVTSLYAFLTPELSYGVNTVNLELTRNQTSFADMARTFNQRETAQGAESLGQGNVLYNAITALPNDNDLIAGTFDRLSGEIHASAKATLIEDSHFVRDAVNNRIRSAFGDVAATGMPVMAYGPGGPHSVAADSIGTAAWGQVYGAWGETDSDGNAARLETSTGGFLAGIDGAITPDIRLGLLAGYGHSSFNADDRASSGASDDYHLGLYGGGQWDAFRLSGGLAYSWHDIETERAVAFRGFTDSSSANQDAGTFQAFGEAGYRIATDFATFEPFVGLAHVSTHTAGFVEDGGAAALSGDSQSMDTTFTTLGLHAATQLVLGGMSATAHGTFGWRHAFGDTSPASTQAFAGGGAFTVAGAPIAEDAAIIEAGLDLDLSDNATFGVTYSGQIAGEARQHGFSAKLSVNF